MHLANRFLEDHGQAMQPKTEAMRQLLDNYLNHVDAYSQSALFLQGQTARAAQLLSDAISFKISITTQAQTDYMLDLTVSTSDDSMTVRVITIVTLIYLPSTFMAVSSNTPGEGLPKGGNINI
jgi:redox-regulated HSP33 family molecular chaperone